MPFVCLFKELFVQSSTNAPDGSNCLSGVSSGGEGHKSNNFFIKLPEFLTILHVQRTPFIKQHVHNCPCPLVGILGESKGLCISGMV